MRTRAVVRLFAVGATVAAVVIPNAGAHAAPGSLALGDFVASVAIQPDAVAPTQHQLTFAALNLSGLFVSDDGSQQYVGGFGVHDMTADDGVVNSFAWNSDGFAGLGVLHDGTCDGSYTEALDVMQLTLHCAVAINNGSTEQNFHATVHVTAASAPLALDGATASATQALLVGAFTSVA